MYPRSVKIGKYDPTLPDALLNQVDVEVELDVRDLLVILTQRTLSLQDETSNANRDHSIGILGLGTFLMQFSL